MNGCGSCKFIMSFCNNFKNHKYVLHSTVRLLTLRHNEIVMHPEVAEALKLSKPVVALESTIITHGMPYPHNLKTAIEVQNIIRKHSATPATVGFIKGKIYVGMDDSSLQYLAKNDNTHKLSRRDLAVASSNKYSGGTTVSATMIIAKWCGIKIFVTGGIGGVHRMGETTMDISADLKELGQTPLMVVSAGVKSILDIGRTLEYLETQGVTVATFDKSKNFPAFFTQSSGYQSPYNVESIEEAANLLKAHTQLGMDSGVLLAVPIPNDFAQMGHTIDVAISQALDESRKANVSGKEVTPYVLQRVSELTDGLSLQANIALIKNNAKIGAQVAKRYSELLASKRKVFDVNDKRTVVIGGSNIDIFAKCSETLECGGASNQAVVSQSLGGVGRNISEVLWRLNGNPFFISAVGDDANGQRIIKQFHDLDTSGVTQVAGGRTGIYNAVFNTDGEIFVAVADLNIHENITPDNLTKEEERVKGASLVCVDGNIPTTTMSHLCSMCSRFHIPILFEPTEVSKAGRCYLAKHSFQQAITYMTPSLHELASIYEAATGKQSPSFCNQSNEVDVDDGFLVRSAAVMCSELLQYTSCILVTLGSRGVLAARKEAPNTPTYTHYPLSPRPSWGWLDEPIANVCGAGDSFAGGFIFGLLRHNADVDFAVRVGITVAQRTLRSHRSVSCAISDRDLKLSASDWKGNEVVI